MEDTRSIHQSMRHTGRMGPNGAELAKTRLSSGRDMLVSASPGAIREHWGQECFLSGVVRLVAVVGPGR